jgi:hypothetical protein
MVAHDGLGVVPRLRRFSAIQREWRLSSVPLRVDNQACSYEAGAFEETDYSFSDSDAASDASRLIAVPGFVKIKSLGQKRSFSPN